MSRQDKATTERHTRQLRELVKRPENKVCADCKRNDPRWASWNIGVFLCIRCSGIHRGMGTHISKVKSIDLDTWTPEQMESIMKWGNRRANAYWEAHLKSGHIPPEHKMESFVRSKYESRRWAMDGPPPRDPSILDDGAPAEAPAAAPSPAPTPAVQAARAMPSRASPAPPVTTRQPTAHQLLSTQHVRAQASRPAAAAPAPDLFGSTPSPAAAAPTQAAPAPAQPANDLFSLDFNAPAAPASPPAQEPKKDVKNDIMSLFSSGQPAAAAAPQASGGFGSFQQNTSQWGQPVQPAQPNVGFNAWSQPTQPQQQQQQQGWGQQNQWGQPAAPAAQPNLFGDNVWATPSAPAGAGAGMSSGADIWGAPAAAPAPAKKDDVFGDLWGGFK